MNKNFISKYIFIICFCFIAAGARDALAAVNCGWVGPGNISCGECYGHNGSGCVYDFSCCPGQVCGGLICNPPDYLNVSICACEGQVEEEECAQGYYLSGSGCVSCTTISSPTGLPTSGATTSWTGATSHTQCFLPAGSSSDGTGAFTWSTCYSS